MNAVEDMRTVVKRLLPGFVLRPLERRHQARLLSEVARREFPLENLVSAADVRTEKLFRSESVDRAWAEARQRLEVFALPDGTGGANPGDRRALYYLVTHFKPRAVLEVGTFIGASTMNLAVALSGHCVSEPAGKWKLDTVDLADVNDRATRPWLAHGGRFAPIEMIEKLGFGGNVSFIRRSSLEHMATCKERYGLVFLDGAYSASMVYQEIAGALRLLSPRGVIVLHNYFPHLRSLWSNGKVISGPHLATERIRQEGVAATVLPLGALPWPTKLDSTVTSLALFLRAA